MGTNSCLANQVPNGVETGIGATALQIARVDKQTPEALQLFESDAAGVGVRALVATVPWWVVPDSSAGNLSELRVSRRQRTRSLYGTFTAPIRKCLIMNGAGEGNRSLVMIAKVYFQGNALFSVGIPQEFHHRAPLFWADSERVTTAYHSVSLGNLPALPGRTAMREVAPWSSLLVGNIIP